MSESKFDGVIVAGTCFVCGGNLICEADGVTLRCEKCGLSLKVQRPAMESEPPAPDTSVENETPATVEEAPAEETPAKTAVEPTASEEVDVSIVVLADSLLADPTAPIPAARMNALTMANDTTKRAILPQVLELANKALAARKFRRAIPLFTLANSVAPSAELYMSIMLAKAGCTTPAEIPDSNTELTTMAEYTGFLRVADKDTRADFLQYVRRQAERMEEAEETRMEEERLAYIAVQRTRLKWLTPFCFATLALAILFFAGIVTLGVAGIQFSLARAFFGAAIGCAILSIVLFAVANFILRNINRAEDMETDNRGIAVVTITSLALMILSAVVLFFSGISGGYDGRTDGFYYRHTEGGVAISAPATDATALTIPETMDGHTVVTLTDFSESRALRTVVIPKTVTKIEQFAFAGCTTLTEITLPDELTTIEGGVFKDCISLKTITIPAGVPALNGYLFSGCTNLESVRFAEGSTLSTIAINAFAGCTALTTIDLPATLATIEDSAFYGCTALTGFTGGTGLVTIGGKAFWGCSSLFELVFSEGLTTIGAQAFENCSALMAVTTPITIRSIGAYAFRDCINLIDVIIPTGSATLGTGVFNGCDNLEQVYTPETPADQFTYTIANGEVIITGYIGTDAIVNVPAKIENTPVISIGKGAFTGNRKLTNVTLPNGLLFVGESAFENCTSLVSVRFGTDLVEIGMYAFKNCNALSALALDGCTSLTTIREQAFLNCWELAEIRFAPNLQIIQSYAFESCRKLSSVSLPNSLTELRHGAFRGCTGLRTFSFGTGALQVYAHAFTDCSALKSISIPVNVTIVIEELNGVLQSAFTGWKVDQMIFIRYARPDNFPGFGPGCEATERWG